MHQPGEPLPCAMQILNSKPGVLSEELRTALGMSGGINTSLPLSKAKHALLHGLRFLSTRVSGGPSPISGILPCDMGNSTVSVRL